MTEIVLPNTASSQATAIEQSRAVAEVAAAVRVAQEFQRDEQQVEVDLPKITGRLAIANRAFYEVPNRGAGMSVHIARELARLWGNIDYGVRELSRDDVVGESEMQAWAWDQEKNVRSTRSFIQPHAKSLRNGGRKALTDLNDIYLNNQNTAARAVRECIFTVLPGWLTATAEAQLKDTLKRGDGKPIEQRRTDATTMFDELGVTLRQLETRLGAAQTAWQPKDLATLARIYSTVTQDGISIGEFFPEQAVEVTQAS
ncbi:hypothetical protein M2390_003137 [Mycetocola sp. BIGb0189]|uniref:hypothetical protein n=1 Tax=Mycetocola sp. BIGb0189 TaxID=2940604 RepID=UPI0021684C58|nr:hypothetical protein [Mycetocola sp. BIGb0189]MCS4277921.1 hypothetical protein [Mycetocola sp. BIGb0189]